MNRKPAAFLAGTLFLGTVAVAAAEPATPEPSEITPDPSLSLAETVDYALARSPAADLPGAYANEAGAIQDRARQWFAGPAEAGLRHQSDIYMDDRGLTEWEAAVSLPLWRPGQRGAQGALAGGAGEVAQAVGSSLRLRVAGQVREALWQLMLAGEQAKLTRQVWDTAAALVKDVKRRVETGDLPRTDLLLAQDEALTRKDDYLMALQRLQDTRRAYIRLTGLNRQPAEPGEPRASVSRIVPGNHPLLHEAQARVQRSSSEVEVLRKRGSGQPHLVFNARRERAFAGELFEDSLGVTITLPIGGGAHVAPEIAAGNRSLAEAETERNRLQRELELELRNAEQRIATLRSELPLAEERQKNAAETLRMARIAFNVGEMDLAEFLRVQNRAQTAEAALRIRRLELKQAIAQYNQAAGETP